MKVEFLQAAEVAEKRTGKGGPVIPWLCTFSSCGAPLVMPQPVEGSTTILDLDPATSDYLVPTATAAAAASLVKPAAAKANLHHHAQKDSDPKGAKRGRGSDYISPSADHRSGRTAGGGAAGAGSPTSKPSGSSSQQPQNQSSSSEDKMTEAAMLKDIEALVSQVKAGALEINLAINVEKSILDSNSTLLEKNVDTVKDQSKHAALDDPTGKALKFLNVATLLSSPTSAIWAIFSLLWQVLRPIASFFIVIGLSYCIVMLILFSPKGGNTTIVRCPTAAAVASVVGGGEE
jgi:hypothetical protein